MVRYMDSSLNWSKEKENIEQTRTWVLLSRTRYLKVEATSREIRRFKTDLMTRDNVRRVVCRWFVALLRILHVRDSINIVNLIVLNIQKIIVNIRKTMSTTMFHLNRFFSIRLN